MTPPATAAARRATRAAAPARAPRSHRRAPVKRSPVPRVARRVSGPARRRGRAAVAPALGPRLLEALRGLPDRRLVDRLLRGRSWIGVVGFLLIGIVAMQVSLLKLNASINRAVEQTAGLELRNGELRAEVSRLSSGDRIEQAAARLGMVMAPAGQVHFLSARARGDARRAAAAVRSWTVRPVVPTAPVASDQGAPAVPAAPVSGTLSTDAQASQPVTASPAGQQQTSAAGAPAAPATPTTGATTPAAGAARPGG